MFEAMLRQLLYPAPPIPVPSPPPTPLRQVAVEAIGHPVSAWWHPPAEQHRSGQDACLLFLHGNGENLETVRLGGLFRSLARMGIGCLAIDYPGYGRSGGEPSQASLTAAAEAAWEALGRDQPKAQRLLMGWSLGAAVAAQLAGRLVDRGQDAPVALALLSPWNDLASLAKVHFTPFLAAVGVPDSYDSAAALAHSRCPIMVVHGTDDDLIPLAQAERLVASLETHAPTSPRFLALRGVGHNDLLGRDQVWQALDNFFTECLQ